MSLVHGLLLTVFLLMSAISAFGQGGAERATQDESRFRECGDPRMESMIWLGFEGEVVEVLDGSTLVILFAKDHKEKRVHLAGIEASWIGTPEGKEAREMLVRLALNKHAEILVNPKVNVSAVADLAGVVAVSGRAVNPKMIELGMARYKHPDPYVMSDYAACTYRVIEKEAKANRRGIWMHYYLIPLPTIDGSDWNR